MAHLEAIVYNPRLIMVDFSLRKAKHNWKHISSPSKAKSQPSSPTKFKANPYQDLKVSTDYSQLPEINTKDRNKVGTSMQRRLSVHNPKYVPPVVDHAAIPLPQLDPTEFSGSKPHQPVSKEVPARSKRRTGDIYNGKSLRQILSDPKFQAKVFVTDNLGNANAIEIDQFTSNLNDLSLEVADEIKDNINKSYAEILLVNMDLDSASTELRQLRSTVNDLKEVMNEFQIMAEKRLQIDKQALGRTQPDNSGLLPPAKTSKRRDRTSVMMLEKMWNNELTTLFKSVEGAQKFISLLPGRHILMESNDWFEINAATLKASRNVHMFVLNDMILVAARNPDKQQHELVVSQCSPLKDIGITRQGENRLAINFANRNQALYQSRKKKEYDRFVSVIRRAKDDLKDIFQAEQENVRRIRDSFNHLQSTQNTPGRDFTLSPAKGHGRNTSLGNMSPKPQDSSNEHMLLQTITASMRSKSLSSDSRSLSRRLRQLDDEIEEFDVLFARHDFKQSVQKLKLLDEAFKQFNDEAGAEELILIDFLRLKVSHRRQNLVSKLSQVISTDLTDASNLMLAVETLISLDYPNDALELYLQNRGRYIQDLILQIGAFDNPTNYLTQIAVIRFQTLKNVVFSVQHLFKNDERVYSSILVNWCSEQVDKHFSLVDKQLLNHEMISPASIKSSRRQIDELKVVGMDFVYKLDDFISRNGERIR